MVHARFGFLAIALSWAAVAGGQPPSEEPYSDCGVLACPSSAGQVLTGDTDSNAQATPTRTRRQLAMSRMANGQSSFQAPVTAVDRRRAPSGVGARQRQLTRWQVGQRKGERWNRSPAAPKNDQAIANYEPVEPDPNAFDENETAPVLSTALSAVSTTPLQSQSAASSTGTPGRIGTSALPRQALQATSRQRNPQRVPSRSALYLLRGGFG